jgi:hypothetical protein
MTWPRLQLSDPKLTTRFADPAFWYGDREAPCHFRPQIDAAPTYDLMGFGIRGSENQLARFCHLCFFQFGIRPRWPRSMGIILIATPIPFSNAANRRFRGTEPHFRGLGNRGESRRQRRLVLLSSPIRQSDRGIDPWVNMGSPGFLFAIEISASQVLGAEPGQGCASCSLQRWRLGFGLCVSPPETLDSLSSARVREPVVILLG